MQFAAEQRTAAAHAGAMQIVANLLRDAANLLQHHRFCFVDAQLLAAHGTQRALHHRERGFQAVGEVGQRRAVFIIAFAFAFQQAVEIADQPRKLSGGVRVEHLAVMLLQFAHLFGQRFDRAQAPPRRDPQ